MFAIPLIVGGLLVMRVGDRKLVVESPRITAASVPSAALAPDANDAGSAASKAFYAGQRLPVPALTDLGRRLFADTSLSAKGDRSCQTCHAPAFAYGPAPDAPPGVRAIPSLRYLQTVPRFTLHHTEEDGIDQGPAGGFMWDGRAETAHDQARLPLLSESEMGNGTEAALAARIRACTSASEIQKVFGDDVFATDTSTIRALLRALEVFEQSPPDFAPFDSKYDAYLRGQTKLEGAEERGHKLFDSKEKGNCASCHVSDRRETGFPLFTDWGFVALAVPSKNGAPPDRGLCERKELAPHPELCGAFRTPSLRNVAKRDRFFHNGVVTNLAEAVRFYATRDVTPARWQPSDRANANMDPPFGKKQPALNEAEIADVVTFLGTLTDGWRP